MEKTYEIRPDQSTELLKELHILTRDQKLNQDSRRKSAIIILQDYRSQKIGKISLEFPEK